MNRFVCLFVSYKLIFGIDFGKIKTFPEKRARIHLFFNLWETFININLLGRWILCRKLLRKSEDGCEGCEKNEV